MTTSAQVAGGGGGRSAGGAAAGDARETRRPPVIPSRTSGECERCQWVRPRETRCPRHKQNASVPTLVQARGGRARQSAGRPPDRLALVSACQSARQSPPRCAPRPLWPLRKRQGSRSQNVGLRRHIRHEPSPNRLVLLCLPAVSVPRVVSPGASYDRDPGIAWRDGLRRMLRLAQQSRPCQRLRLPLRPHHHQAKAQRRPHRRWQHRQSTPHRQRHQVDRDQPDPVHSIQLAPLPPAVRVAGVRDASPVPPANQLATRGGLRAVDALALVL